MNETKTAIEQKEIVRKASYCRVCQAACGVIVEITDGQISDVRGDPDNPLSRGYICSKGREAASIHHGETRLVSSLTKDAQGNLTPIDLEDAIEQISDRLSEIIEESGPNSVALFQGTHALFSALTTQFAKGWLRGLGSTSLYSTGTIDQSAKWIVPMRMGHWLGGWQRFSESDVWLLCGTNPLVSMQGGGTLTGFPAYDPVKRLKEAKQRGLKLIVIDPRYTETARQADMFLQPIPGKDWAVFAGLIRIVLREGWHDVEFCNRFVNDLDELQQAIFQFTPEFVERLTAVPADQLVETARMFADASRGMAHGGTGPDMAPHCNLTEHLIAALNVVCGRYARAGDAIAHPGVLTPPKGWREGVLTLSRMWEGGVKTVVGGYGGLWNELPTTALPDQMLHNGEGRVRALIVVGGNPVACWPDQARTRRALESLDLLVVIDPRKTQTAEVADYVIAPAVGFERPDHTAWYENIFTESFAQYTEALIEPPPDTVEDWQFFYRLAEKMEKPLVINRQPHAEDFVLEGLESEPSSEEMLRRFVSETRVQYDELIASPHGKLWEFDEKVGPLAGESDKFRLIPDDVLAELNLALADSEEDDAFPLRLIVRRVRWLMNSFGEEWPSYSRALKGATAWMHPGDMSAHGIEDDAEVTIQSSCGAIRARVLSDNTLQPGVVSMPHCLTASSTSVLVDSRNRATINAMPVFTGIPVRVLVESEAGADA